MYVNFYVHTLGKVKLGKLGNSALVVEWSKALTREPCDGAVPGSTPVSCRSFNYGCEFAMGWESYPSKAHLPSNITIMINAPSPSGTRVWYITILLLSWGKWRIILFQAGKSQELYIFKLDRAKNSTISSWEKPKIPSFLAGKHQKLYVFKPGKATNSTF